MTNASDKYGYEDSLALDTGGEMNYEAKSGMFATWCSLAWFVAKCFFWSIIVAAFVILWMAV